MSNCTRTRNIRFSTPLNDLLWNRDQDRQSSLIQAQDAAADFHSAAAVMAAYDFLASDTETYFTAAGQPLQLGMELVSRTDPADRALVIFTPSTNEWAALLPVPATHSAQALIGAVQARIEANRAARLQSMQVA